MHRLMKLLKSIDPDLHKNLVSNNSCYDNYYLPLLYRKRKKSTQHSLVFVGLHCYYHRNFCYQVHRYMYMYIYMYFMIA